MKHLFLAVTALSLAGTIGTANAVPDISNTVEIWNNPSSGAGSSMAPDQQALPSAISGGGTSAPLTNVLGTTTYVASINYCLGGSTAGCTTQAVTIPGFFASNIGPIVAGTPTGCTGPCATNTLSSANFNAVTLFEYNFTTTTPEIFSVTHDDGVSLFVAGSTDETGCMAGNAADCMAGDQLSFSASGPTPSQFTQATIAAGTYDLWYTSANGLPEILQTDTEPVPAPLIGHGLFVLLSVGGVFFGGKFLEGLKKRHLHAA
jgi:hypothetical protein